MLIYIRHSEETLDDPTHEHDPKLTSEGQDLAYKKGVRLLQKYGLPDIIYCSPFRRTRETLDHMLRDLSERTRARIQIVYDPDSARHFKHSEQDNPDVARTTMKCDIPIYEDRKEFRSRVKKLALKLGRVIEPGQVIWCVTHTTVYKRLARLYEVNIPRIIPHMHYFIIRDSSEVQQSKPNRQHRKVPAVGIHRKRCNKCRRYH